MNNGITLFDQLPEPTTKASLLYKLCDYPWFFRVIINGAKINSQNNSGTAQIIVSFTITEDIPRFDSKNKDIKEGDIYNQIFFVGNMEDYIYIEKDMPFYSIISYILKNKGVIPKNHNKPIKFFKGNLNKCISNTTLILKIIDDNSTNVIKTPEVEMVGGL